MSHVLTRQSSKMRSTCPVRAASIDAKQLSPHVSCHLLRTYAIKTDAIQVRFYKSFGRPIAKVFLGAVFTYQVVYWGWVKLETDEIKRQKKGKSFLTSEKRLFC